MTTITTGVYRHLKDRAKPICDKLKLVRVVWKSNKVFLQNKEQVLLDFLIGLILNKKKSKVSEEDVCSLWKTLHELLQNISRRKSSKVIIIKPSICQVINDSTGVHTDYQHIVISCCQCILISHALSHVYTKFEQLSVLLEKVLQLIDKSENVSTVSPDVWLLLQTILPKYLQVERSHPNQRLVFQRTTEKMLVSVLSVWHKTRKTTWADIGDDVLKVLNNSVLNKDHWSSYSVFLQSINPDHTESPQIPKYIEHLFDVMSGCLECMALQSNTTEIHRRNAVHQYIPLFFRGFIDSYQISDCTIVRNLLVYLCKLLHLNISKESEPHPVDTQSDTDVLEVIGVLLNKVLDLDLYDKSHDPVYRQLVLVLLLSERTSGYFKCLVLLLKLNHLIVEAKLDKILQQINSDSIQELNGLNDFMVELVILYSKLRQMEKLMGKLARCALEGNSNTKCLFTNGFRQRLGTEVETLPQGTAVEILQTLVQKVDDFVRTVISKENSDSAMLHVENFDTFVVLLEVFMSNIKLVDYTVTEINKRKVKDILDAMATQLCKLTEFTVNHKKNRDLLYPVMMLLYSWGELNLLMCQFTNQTSIAVSASQEYPQCISVLYHFLSSDVIEKILKFTGEDPRLRYIWDMLLIQTVKALWISNQDRKQCVQKLNFDLPSGKTDVWNGKVSDVTGTTYPVARWKLLTDNFALLWNDLSVTQIEACADCINSTLGGEEKDGNLTMSSISKTFVKSCAMMEHRDILTAVISDVWRKVDISSQPKKGKKKMKIDCSAPASLFTILGNKAWLKKDNGFIENTHLKHYADKALKTPSLDVAFPDSFQRHISLVLSSLPLHYLSPLDQTRCFLGLLVSCYHGNSSLQKLCLPPMTFLVDSSKNVLKLVDIEILMTTVCHLFALESNKQEMDTFVEVLIKSVANDEQLMTDMNSVVIKTTDAIKAVEKSLKAGKLINKEQETTIRFTQKLIQTFTRTVRKRSKKDDIVSSAEKYITDLLEPALSVIPAAKNVSKKELVLQPVAYFFPALVKYLDEKDEKLQTKFEDLLSWAFEQLDDDKSSESKTIAVSFLNRCIKLQAKLDISKDVKSQIFDKAYTLLLKMTSEKLKSKEKISKDETYFKSLVSLVTTVIVSCDLGHFKDMLHKLELSINVDLALARKENVLVCMYVWSSLMSAPMSEKHSSHYMQSVTHLTGYLTSLAQQLSDNEDKDIGRALCELQNKVMDTCPVTKSMIMTILTSVILVPVSMETFTPMYEILELALINHANDVVQITPVFLNCVKKLMFWLVEQGDQDKLTKSPERTVEVLACVHRLVKLFSHISTHKEEFKKPVVYLVADYVDHVHHLTLLPVIKKALVTGIYYLLDICDKFILAQLHTVLNQGIREVFRGLYEDYTNFYKFTGKI